LSVSVVVPGNLSSERETHLLQLIRAAAGTDTTRGDVVVLESLDRLAGPVAMTNEAPPGPSDIEHPSLRQAATGIVPLSQSKTVIALATTLVMLIVVGIVALLSYRRQNGRLSNEAREELLADILSTLQANRTDGHTRI